MMPIYDAECGFCGHIHEHIARHNEEAVRCPKCGNWARRIISASGVFTANEDAPWIRSVLEVVEKEGHCAVSNEFLRNPTRTNYKRWMAEKGIRPMENEHGGPPSFKRPNPISQETLTKLTYERYRKRNILEVR